MQNELTFDRQGRSTGDVPVSLNVSADYGDIRRSGALEVALEHPLVQEALTRLRDELPTNLPYHSYQHTVDVLERVIGLAITDRLSERDVTLLAIAAAWHDTGFIVQPARNEPIAAEWAREAMLRHGGFDESEIHDVEAAILATQVKFDAVLRAPIQECSGRLSPWLLDADLANFGQPNFMVKSAQVYAELVGRPISSARDFLDDTGRQYVATTSRMLAAHRWHSNAATVQLSEQKGRNVVLLNHFLTELDGRSEASLLQAWNALHAGSANEA